MHANEMRNDFREKLAASEIMLYVYQFTNNNHNIKIIRLHSQINIL